MLLFQQLTSKIIAAAIELHRCLGPGLLESAYVEALCDEFRRRGISFRCEVTVPLVYKGKTLGSGYRVDLIVEDMVVVEVKAVDQVLPVHLAQLMTYMRLSKTRVGLLINFKVALLKQGIHRRIL